MRNAMQEIFDCMAFFVYSNRKFAQRVFYCVLTGFSYSLDNSFVLVYYITVIYNSVMSGDD